jgi:hypothetical protein
MDLSVFNGCRQNAQLQKCNIWAEKARNDGFKIALNNLANQII